MAGGIVRVPVSDASQVGAARRAAAALAEQAELEGADAGRAALIATELATNLARYARDGELLLRVLARGDDTGVELLAIDRGPGMAEPERCLADGFSTGPSAGIGLGAVRRAATRFDVHSSQPQGTVLVARVFAARAGKNAQAEAVTWGTVSLPLAGESACGDAWSVVERPDTVTFLVADGLGHGALAAAAANAAVEALHHAVDVAPARVLADAHARLRGTRGAAVAVGTVTRATKVLRYAGIGNVATRVLSATGARSLVSLNGTVGVQMPAPKEFDCAWPAGALLVCCSDGITSRWDLDPALAGRDPAVIAGALYRDHARRTDDTTVLVGRMATAHAAGGLAR